MALMYLMYQYYWKKPTSPETTDLAEYADDTMDATSAVPKAATGLAGMLGMPQEVPAYYKMRLTAAWPEQTRLDFRVYVSLKREMSFEETCDAGIDGAVWSASDLPFGTLSESYLKENITLEVPEQVSQGNTTWFAHVFVVKGNLWERDNVKETHIEGEILYARHEFIRWLDVDRRKSGKNLLGDEVEKEPEGDNSEDDDEDDEIRYDQVWKPTMPVVLVANAGPIVLGQMPITAAAAYRVNVKEKTYYPPMHVNEFWMLRDTLLPMNNTVKRVTVEMAFEPISLYKWSVYKQFENVWDKQIAMGTMKPHETDEFKRIFIGTNPVLLGTTIVVSMAHTVLEALAFKNDISHWKNIKSMEGVSVRSMIWKIVMEAIIFLYLWDNETSWMITVGNSIGLAIQIWKLGKAVKFENFGKRKLFGFIPWFDMVDRESYSKETKEYDDQAMKYLGYALYPLVAIYSLYSLKYEKHKSWYSWIINSLVGAVYAFGFIMMFPQIFINYKLKSVAHMPMKAMMYKTLNTIIDDLFSFIIKMPWLHRLACFRDDVVFLILLYQRWIYPVDKKRVNEFGQQFDEDDQEKAGSAPEQSSRGELSAEQDHSTGSDRRGMSNARKGVEEKPSEEKKND